MSRELARAKQRYETDALEAHRTAAANLIPALDVNFYLTGWTRKAQEAYRDQWVLFVRAPDRSWDWDAIFQRHRDPDRFEIVIWAPGDRLAGLGIGLTTGRALVFRFFEGDPRPDCPLTGRRILIALEAAACYAQARGKTELRLQPINDRLAALYQDGYGFILEAPKGEQPYLRRTI